MADGDVAALTRTKGGRPKKARGASTSSDAADARWTVRGVPVNVRAMATKAAEIRGMTVGDWLSEAVVAHARSAKIELSADGEGVSADAAVSVPAIPLGDELAKALAGINDRLEKLEADRRKPLIQRVFGRRGA